MNRFSRDRHPKSYNFADPSDKSVQFYFYLRSGFAYEGKDYTRFGFTVKEEECEGISEFDYSPLEALLEIQGNRESKYMWAGNDDKRIAALVYFLEPFELMDKKYFLESEILKHEAKLSDMREDLEQVIDFLAEGK